MPQGYGLLEYRSGWLDDRHGKLQTMAISQEELGLTLNAGKARNEKNFMRKHSAESIPRECKSEHELGHIQLERGAALEQTSNADGVDDFDISRSATCSIQRLGRT